MGNCLKPLEYEARVDEFIGLAKQSKWHGASHQPGTETICPKEFGETFAEDAHNNAYTATDEGNVTRISNSPASSPKGENSWRRFLHQTQAESVHSKDQEDCSIFGENWEPELFDQRQVFPADNGAVTTAEHEAQHGSKPRPNIWTRWASDESLDHTKTSKKLRLAVLPSTLLGFSPYPTESGDGIEWYRNGELEVPKPDTNSFLIKGKHRIAQATTRPSKELDSSHESCQEGIRSIGTKLFREGWLRYTMFVHQNKTDVCRFHANFRTAKHIFLSLETKTGCELRLSKQLFIYRGKLVRLCVIDGPTRKSIIRCYTSLPTILTKVIISECERPSVLEPQTNLMASGLGQRSLNSTVLPLPIPV